jgi:hypothetical protein
MLANETAPPKPKRALVLRDSHHMLARLQACGLRGKELVARSGYSQGRVWNLQTDPSYQELVAKYRAEVDQAWLRGIDSFVDAAMGNMLMAERIIADRLEADEDTIRLRDLDAIAQGRADRFGYGKRSTQVNIDAGFGAALDRAIKRSGKNIDPSPAGLAEAQGLGESPQPPAPAPIRRVLSPPLILEDEPESAPPGLLDLDPDLEPALPLETIENESCSAPAQFSLGAEPRVGHPQRAVAPLAAGESPATGPVLIRRRF